MAFDDSLELVVSRRATLYLMLPIQTSDEAWDKVMDEVLVVGGAADVQTDIDLREDDRSSD